MSIGDRLIGFPPQDWIIIDEAFAQWAGAPDEAERRKERAYELLSTRTVNVWFEIRE